MWLLFKHFVQPRAHARAFVLFNRTSARARSFALTVQPDTVHRVRVGKRRPMHFAVFVQAFCSTTRTRTRTRVRVLLLLWLSNSVLFHRVWAVFAYEVQMCCLHHCGGSSFHSRARGDLKSYVSELILMVFFVLLFSSHVCMFAFLMQVRRPLTHPFIPFFIHSSIHAFIHSFFHFISFLSSS